MTQCAFRDDEDYPLRQWADDSAVFPDPSCGTCTGDGFTDEGLPCPCLVFAARERFPVAADEASAQPGCVRCDGDGEDINGELCPCVLLDLRALAEEELEDRCP